jgi:hypothetical protein
VPAGDRVAVLERRARERDLGHQHVR